MSMTVVRISRQGVGEQVAPRTRGSPGRGEAGPGRGAGGPSDAGLAARRRRRWGRRPGWPSDAELARRLPARFIALVLATGLIPPSFPGEETTAPLPAA